MNYGLDVSYQLPDLVAWSNTQNQRIDQRAKERNDAYRNLMQMLGRGVGAYKMNRDYKDWKDDQEMWDEEGAMLDMIGAGYYDPEMIDIDKQLSINPYGYQEAYRNNNLDNPYMTPSNKNASQDEYFLYQLGLGGV